MRVALVGGGWIGGMHATALARIPGAEIVAVCDRDPSRARAVAPGAAIHADARELFEREALDAVVIGTPPLTHREIAVEALERGLHVYLEKPIARGLDDASAIVAAADASEAVCAIGYQWRSIEALEELREELDGQEIGIAIGVTTGPTLSRPWFLDRAQGGGNVLERASHTIDLQRAIVGEVETVQAMAGSVALAQSVGERGDIEDEAVLVLGFASGAVGSTSVAWARDGVPGRHTIDLVATEASLRLELGLEVALRGVSRGRRVERRREMDAIERNLARFLAAAEAGDKAGVFCTPQDAAGTLAVVVACEEALATQRPVRVPPL